MLGLLRTVEANYVSIITVLAQHFLAALLNTATLEQCSESHTFYTMHIQNPLLIIITDAIQTTFKSLFFDFWYSPGNYVYTTVFLRV